MVEALVGEQKINRVYCLRAQPTAQAPGENTKQEIEIPRETKSDTITYTQINTHHTQRTKEAGVAEYLYQAQQRNLI